MLSSLYSIAAVAIIVLFSRGEIVCFDVSVENNMNWHSVNENKVMIKLRPCH